MELRRLVKIIEISLLDNNLIRFFKALASETRLSILNLIAERNDLDISRLAEGLKQTEANISAQVKILEKVGLIISHYEPGQHGVKKISTPAFTDLIITTYPIMDKKFELLKVGEKPRKKKPIKRSEIRTLEEFFLYIHNNPIISFERALELYQKVCEKNRFNSEYCIYCAIFNCEYSGRSHLNNSNKE